MSVPTSKRRGSPNPNRKWRPTVFIAVPANLSFGVACRFHGCLPTIRAGGGEMPGDWKCQLFPKLRLCPI